MVLSVRFEHCGREFELRPAWPPSVQAALPDGLERVECIGGLWSPWSTTPRWLRSCDAWRLRALAEEVDGGPGVLQQRDAQVHAAVGRLLQQGRLRLFELRRCSPADQQRVEAAGTSVPAVTPSMLRAAPAATAAPAPPAAVVAAPVIDPDRQAAVLRRAAELGTPFCEECERRRQVAELEPA